MRSIGGKALKWISPGHPGVPDRICFFPPHAVGSPGPIVFVEVKGEGEAVVPKSNQERTLNLLNDYFGHSCAVIRTKYEVENLIRVYKEAMNELRGKAKSDSSNTIQEQQDPTDSTG